MVAKPRLALSTDLAENKAVGCKQELNEAAARRLVWHKALGLLISDSYDLVDPVRVAVGDAPDARHQRRAFGAHNGSNKRKIFA
jgi:hypothetical protein